MLYAADIHIYRKVFICLFSGNKGLTIVAVHIAQEVPGGTGPLRHGIGLSLCSSSADRTGGIDPLVNGSQRRFTGTGRLIALYLRQTQRKLILRNRHAAALWTVDDRNGLAPVSLTGEYPVAQLVVDCLASKALFFDHLRSFFFQNRGLHAVPFAGIDHGSTCLCIGFSHIFNFLAVLCDYLNDRKAEFLSKFKVSVIMGRYTHDGTCAVISQYIIGQPDWRLCSI